MCRNDLLRRLAAHKTKDVSAISSLNKMRVTIN